MPVQRQTPMRCPLCDGDLVDIRVRNIGDVTARLLWQLHAGRCPEHGWFQAEIISKPPREIFPVNRPGGVARRLEIDGQPVFSFPTVWDSRGEFRQVVDPLDPELWKVDWDRVRIAPPASGSTSR